MPALYNEIDRYPAAWLRNLIAAGHIAPGTVDERSVGDIEPSELAGYTQAHFFAGIGVWSHALRLAGVADGARVWTGSCPCQPFSAAGKRRGADDERHLWPAWFRLIRECRPGIVFGEQVAQRAGREWFAAVRDDLEGIGYAVGACALPACSAGAPHLRERIFFVAHSSSDTRGRLDEGRQDGAGAPDLAGARGWLADTGGEAREQRLRPDARAGCDAGRVADAADAIGGGGERGEEAGARENGERGRGSPGGGAAGLVEHAERAGLEGHPGHERDGDEPGRLGAIAGGPATAAGAWSDVEWIPCRDGTARPVEPGTFPLAHGAPARVGRLRAYGNAIVAPLAAEFIRAALRCLS